VPPLTSAALVALAFVCARLGTFFSIGPIAPVVPTGCVWGAIPGVRSVARAAVPGARAANAGAMARVSGDGAAVSGDESVSLSSESHHPAREFLDALHKPGGVHRFRPHVSITSEIT
jgi:hypothetical protein